MNYNVHIDVATQFVCILMLLIVVAYCCSWLLSFYINICNIPQLCVGVPTDLILTCIKWIQSIRSVCPLTLNYLRSKHSLYVWDVSLKGDWTSHGSVMVSALNDEINMTGLAGGKKNIETVTVISIRNTVSVSGKWEVQCKDWWDKEGIWDDLQWLGVHTCGQTDHCWLMVLSKCKANHSPVNWHTDRSLTSRLM